ncbi:MAG: DUF4091 domain-containing protein [Candidatus Hydrogenedentes bacterium]|nr:DUF4091 domain-containing protein [Candidatus Hydrogenedentota bacterium]
MKPKRRRSRLGYLSAGVLALALAARGQCTEAPIAAEVAALYTVIENGGFEDGGAMPAYWGRHPAENNDGNRHARDTAVFHSGAASAFIRWVDPIAGPNKAPLQWSRYTIPVEGGIDLLFSGTVKTQGVAPERVGANFYGDDGRYLGFRGLPCPKDADDWTYFEGPIPVPAEAVKMGFVLYSRQGGDTWFDDVALLGVPSAAAWRATPAVDGVLNGPGDTAADGGPCWAGERAITTFVNHLGARVVPRGVRAWIAYDDENLYIAFRCPREPGTGLKEDAVERDGDTWRDDSVEVFLDPWHRHEDYYHFAVNSRGVLRDAHGTDTTWNANVTARTARDESAWCVELAIPLSGLALELDAGTTWGINLAWNNRAANETATWALGGFHNAARFGNVSLDADLTPFLIPAFSRELALREAEAAALRKEIRKSGVRPAVMVDAFRLLADGEKRIRHLRRAASGKGPLPPAAEMRGWLSDLSDTIAAARVAALTSLFGLDGAGEGGALRVGVASSLDKIRRTGPVLDGMIARRVCLEAARDETESFQLVLSPSGPHSGVAVEAGPLAGPGNPIPVEWNPVGYVETGTPTGYEPEYVGWWPDVLMPPGPLDLVAGERQPIWFRVNVPPDAAPGRYKGRVTIRHGEQAVSVPVELRVRSFRLPRPGTLPAAFGLYAHALSGWYHGKRPYQEVMSPETYARWCRFMGAYRLTPKNVANEYHTRRDTEEGKVLDMSLLTRTLGAVAEDYYPPYSFCVYRLPCPRDVQDGTTTTDPAVWIRALTERTAEYARLGLPREAYVYGIDEPLPAGYPFISKVYGMVREAAPGYPIMQTVNHTPPEELAGLVDIWCPLSARVTEDFYQARKAAGDTLWMYVCCGPKPPHANFFVDQPAIDHRMVFWQARQAGATGVLYWCICWWAGIPGPSSGEPHFPDVPIQLKDHADTLKNLGTNGDGMLVWPGPDMTPYPSLRLEVVRDGIEDYEYLALLERCVDSARALPGNGRRRARLLDEAEALCQVPESISRSMTDYTKDPDVLLNRRAAVGDMIERLVEALGEEP